MPNFIKNDAVEHDLGDGVTAVWPAFKLPDDVESAFQRVEDQMCQLAREAAAKVHESAATKDAR